MQALHTYLSLMMVANGNNFKKFLPLTECQDLLLVVQLLSAEIILSLVLTVITLVLMVCTILILPALHMCISLTMVHGTFCKRSLQTQLQEFNKARHFLVLQ